MNDYCAMCAAASKCPRYGSFVEDDNIRCDDALRRLTESTRSEYKHAWNEYIYNFYEDDDIEEAKDRFLEYISIEI